MSERKRIYIIVKTYPTISDKYSELVCTAGVLEDGSWIRLYPIPFRKLDIERKYKKYSWIEVDVERNKQDFRPETYRPVNLDNMTVENSGSSKADWQQRRNIIFRNKKIYTNLKEIINKAKSKRDCISLALFKPMKLIDFIIEPTEREWNKNKLQHLNELSKQMSLFQTPAEIENEFKVVQKVPYKFSYRFKDDAGKESTMMIEDWEIGMLYFNCLKNAKGNESIATKKVKEKYWNDFIKKDLYFILGTTKKFHNIAKNPFIIIGVFYPPYPNDSLMDGQISLLE